MSVLPMKRMLIIGLRKDRKEMLELLQRRGVVEISTSTPNGISGDDDTVFHKIDMSGSKATFDKNVLLATSALEILDKTVPGAKDGSMFSGRVKMSLTDFETNTTFRDEIMSMVYDINTLAKTDSEIQADIPKYQTQLETLQPWISFELPLEFSGTKYTNAFIGTLPNQQDRTQILEQINENAPDLIGCDVSVISSDSEQTCVMIICHVNDSDKLEEALRKMSFARPTVSGGVPKEQADYIKSKLESLNNDSKEIAEKIAAYAPKREQLKFIIDYFTLRADKYEIIGELYQTKRVFLINGYLPAGKCDKLEDLLTSRFDCVTEFSEPSESDDVPVLLKNNWYATPVENVVEGYSLPNKHEIDPTFIASIFYYCLFGLMLSDAGYGLIMVLATGIILAKNKDNMEDGSKHFIQMLLGCGIGTLFWGLMFGSFFGDAVNKIATTFFGRPDIAFPVLWFEPVDKPIMMLGFSFIIGLVHIFTGLGVLFYMNIREHKIKDAIYDVVFWYLLLIGCVGLLMSTEMMRSMFSFNVIFPSPVITLFTVMAIIGAIGIVVFGGRESKNPFKRLLKGLYALYGISSYLSDVLSYSRLLALGLATSVISSVFNQMGTMGGSGVVGVIMFIIIFLLGHTLNLLINALGAYVHTNRLEYVEFFGKFYTGGGRKFEPFTEKTKYFKVQE